MQTAASLLSSLQTVRLAICKDPCCEIPEEIKRLRQANFKNEYKQRQHGRRGGGGGVDQEEEGEEEEMGSPSRGSGRAGGGRRGGSVSSRR